MWYNGFLQTLELPVESVFGFGVSVKPASWSRIRPQSLVSLPAGTWLMRDEEGEQHFGALDHGWMLGPIGFGGLVWQGVDGARWRCWVRRASGQEAVWRRLQVRLRYPLFP
jgi:hypothetical protein